MGGLDVLRVVYQVRECVAPKFNDRNYKLHILQSIVRMSLAEAYIANTDEYLQIRTDPRLNQTCVIAKDGFKKGELCMVPFTNGLK